MVGLPVCDHWYIGDILPPSTDTGDTEPFVLFVELLLLLRVNSKLFLRRRASYANNNELEYSLNLVWERAHFWIVQRADSSCIINGRHRPVSALRKIFNAGMSRWGGRERNTELDWPEEGD